jgi:arylsulfatase
VPEKIAVRVLNRAHSITAEIEIPRGGAEGVVFCHGSHEGGYSLFVKDNKLHYVHNYVDVAEYQVQSTQTLPEGKIQLRFEFEPTGQPEIAKGKGTPGRATLYINANPCGQADFPTTIPLLIGLGGGLSVGRNPGSAISKLYPSPFPFTGTIYQVTVDVSGKINQDTREEERAMARAAMARQ